MYDPDTANNLGAVILAAGYSSRMNKFKALLPVGELTAVERVICSARGMGIKDIVLVTGYQREKLKPIVKKYDLIEAYNPIFDEGMFSSIQAGTKALKQTPAKGFFLMPVDCPVVREDILKNLCDEACSYASGKDTEKNFIVPCYLGKKGHPLYVPMCYADEIIDHDGRRGFKYITDKYEDFLVRRETGSESVILDMDDEAGYKEILKYYENGCKETDLRELINGRRFILIRHGQIEQHSEKIFLGQTDVPLSELGIEQAKAAGLDLKEELLSVADSTETDIVTDARDLTKNDIPTDGQNSAKNNRLNTDRIYSSDLLRASQTTELVAKPLGIQKIEYLPDLREMALGEWDGKYISEVKKKYPEAYEKRGKNIYKFKFDHNSENFYDLQYRVLKEFKNILSRDTNSDIIIVAHSGVLRVISNALAGKDVSDGYTKIANGKYLIISS